MAKSNKIDGCCDIVYSKRDTFGNCYFSFTYTDAKTGYTVSATISGGDSNIRSAMYNLGNVHSSESELPIREYNRLTKGWLYGGCRPDDIANFVNCALAERKREEATAKRKKAAALRAQLREKRKETAETLHGIQTGTTGW